MTRGSVAVRSEKLFLTSTDLQGIFVVTSPVGHMITSVHNLLSSMLRTVTTVNFGVGQVTVSVATIVGSSVMRRRSSGGGKVVEVRIVVVEVNAKHNT